MLAVAATTALVAACGTGAPTAHTDPGSPGAPAVIKPVVLAQIPHDSTAFTQGLELDGTALYEGTGLAGASQLRELDPATGALRRAVATPQNYFGEGITVDGDHVWQLTWQNGVAVEWDKATFSPVREVQVDGEGWGLCRDGDRLIRSDGTDRLRFQDSTSFAEIGAVTVTREGQPVRFLNELECVDGQVWANVWQTDMIVRIDPATGVVNTVVDASGLPRPGDPGHRQVLNGIAHIQGPEFYLTGKNWPSMFRVRLDAPGA